MNHFDEQQEEFEDMIPEVEYVIDEHVNSLTDQEERWLYDYLQFMNNRTVTCPHGIVDKCKTLVKVFGRI